MRRKQGHLLPIELSILEAGIRLRMEGVAHFYGFLVAREIKERQDARLLTAHGTLYKALDRLQRSGLLESEWEDPIVAAQYSRPRRRLYWVTAAGEAALAKARVPVRKDATQRRPQTFDELGELGLDGRAADRSPPGDRLRSLGAAPARRVHARASSPHSG